MAPMDDAQRELLLLILAGSLVICLCGIVLSAARWWIEYRQEKRLRDLNGKR